MQYTKDFHWYLPTFHGDICLTSKASGVTELRAFELTPAEEQAMEALRKHALAPEGGSEPWAAEKDFHELSMPSYRTAAGLTVYLRAPIGEVQAVLAPLLKPKRELLSAVRFVDGRVEEVLAGEASLGLSPEAEKPDTKGSKKSKGDKAKAAVTVAAPVIGCPAPVFPEADVRAARVLEQFLNDSQREDFRMHRAFIAVGADTGRRYRITDRERHGGTRSVSLRSLFDIDEGRPLCVHDWEVPPPEEMLALLLCVSIPGKEQHIRYLPDVPAYV